MQFEKENSPPPHQGAMLNDSQVSNDIWLYGSSVYFNWQIPFLAPTLDNADPLFAMLIKPGFHLHQVEVAVDAQLVAAYKQNTALINTISH